MQSRLLVVLFVWLLFCVPLVSAQRSQPTPQPSPTASAGESSSRDTLTDLNSPDKREASEETEDVEEAHSFDPHRAAKAIEVADFYFKQGNYRGARERYREALSFKENDAEATYGLARTEEKLGNFATARASYEAYLKILPNGPRAKDAKKALEHLAHKQSKSAEPQRDGMLAHP